MNGEYVGTVIGLKVMLRIGCLYLNRLQTIKENEERVIVVLNKNIEKEKRKHRPLWNGYFTRKTPTRKEKEERNQNKHKRKENENLCGKV